MLLENFAPPGAATAATATRPCLFDRFWAGSRYRGAVPGLDVKNNVKQALDEMEAGGGFYAALECQLDGRPAGSLVVFKDPWYRSRRRADVACFGLVTAGDARTHQALH
ncbi:MAG: hypothetical protein Q6373_000940, partial [Candidatus Sigynarchaeota archaeon]